MEQQIANILAQTITKTSKIQQLLMLGLTRRQVADLVTNGNYGFVQNVYKAMQQATPTQIRTTALDYTFRRKFGVEIEAYNCTTTKLKNALKEEGINVEFEGYNHATRPHWKIVSDSSLSGDNTFELVSPILEGESGLKELKKVCWILDACGAKINASCGLHIHFDASNFTLDTWKNLVLGYKTLETIIDNFMPSSRRNNIFCKPLRSITKAAIKNCRNIQELQYSAFNENRYFKLNPMSYNRHKTVEFRQHAGSTDFDKISNWILFLNGLITFATTNEIENGIVLNDIPFLDDEQKTFFRQRTKKINN